MNRAGPGPNSDVTVVLCLGANLGRRVANLRCAAQALRQAGVKVEQASGLYETAPRGVTDQPTFLNAALRCVAAVSPLQLLRVCQAAEKQCGRTPGERWGPRVIDIDILLYGDQLWDEPGLQIPHPRLGERRFMLAPMQEVITWDQLPDGRSIKALLAAVADQDITRIAGPQWLDEGGGLHSQWAR